MKNQLENNKNNINKTVLDLLICCLAVLLIYAGTLTRPWIFYDEPQIYDELVVPIPNNFNESIEIINSFGIVSNISSSNYLYTSNSTNRTNLLGIPFLLTLGLLFKKNAFLYHLLNLLLHLVNTCFVYFILKLFNIKNRLFERLTTIVLTLLWALHPAHVESILLSTNVGATLSYTAFFGLFYDFLKNKENKLSIKRLILISLGFLIPMLLNEYIIALPIIVLAYSLLENLRSKDLKSSIINALQTSSAYLIGLMIYLIYFCTSGYRFFQASDQNQTIITLERILWLSPQIFFHALKLIFYPKTLSIDQTTLVQLGEILFSPYAIFCFLIVMIFFCLIIALRKLTISLSCLIAAFMISLIPFIQLPAPTYCLFAERYLYTPTFFIILILNCLLLKFFNTKKKKISILIALFSIISLFSLRSYIRTTDWQNEKKLLESALKSAPNNLYKGYRAYNLGNIDPNLSLKYYDEGQKILYEGSTKLQALNRTNEPLILKTYGLNQLSQRIKYIYLITLGGMLKNDKETSHYLNLFESIIDFKELFDSSTLELYANLLFINNQVNKSKDIFVYAFNKYPTSPFLITSLIKFERDIENNFSRSKEYLLYGLSLYPYSKEILLEATNHYNLAKDLNNYAKYSYLYGLRTHSEFAYQEALASYLTIGDIPNSEKTIKKLLQINKENPKNLYLSSSFYIKQANLTKAVELLLNAYKYLDKKDQNLHFNISNTLANLYIQLNEKEKAAYFAKIALSIAKTNSAYSIHIKPLIKIADQ